MLLGIESLPLAHCTPQVVDDHLGHDDRLLSKVLQVVVGEEQHNDGQHKDKLVLKGNKYEMELLIITKIAYNKIGVSGSSRPKLVVCSLTFNTSERQYFVIEGVLPSLLSTIFEAPPRSGFQSKLNIENSVQVTSLSKLYGNEIACE